MLLWDRSSMVHLLDIYLTRWMPIRFSRICSSITIRTLKNTPESKLTNTLFSKATSSRLIAPSPLLRFVINVSLDSRNWFLLKCILRRCWYNSHLDHFFVRSLINFVLTDSTFTRGTISVIKRLSFGIFREGLTGISDYLSYLYVLCDILLTPLSGSWWKKAGCFG